LTSWFTDPQAVAAEYASEDALRQWQLAHALAEGPDDEDILRDRILLSQPRRLLTSFLFCLDMTRSGDPDLHPVVL
jgi:hypothetical protein